MLLGSIKHSMQLAVHTPPLLLLCLLMLCLLLFTPVVVFTHVVVVFTTVVVFTSVVVFTHRCQPSRIRRDSPAFSSDVPRNETDVPHF